MLLLHKPGPELIQWFIDSQAKEPYSYPDVGASAGSLPAHYRLDHNRRRIGSGAGDFERARAAVCRWQMFSFDWLRLCWPEAPVAVGTTVAILVKVMGLWSLNACRVVYVLDESGPVDRFGFAYGTLPEHTERGEERFSVEWRHADDSVWYDILAFSRPGHFLTCLAYPYTRRLQKRFAVASMQAMREVVRG